MDTSTIFRTVKNPDNPFVMIDKRPLEDPDISLAAKGLFAYLSVMPEKTINRERYPSDLVDELRAAGYLK